MILHIRSNFGNKNSKCDILKYFFCWRKKEVAYLQSNMIFSTNASYCIIRLAVSPLSTALYILTHTQRLDHTTNLPAHCPILAVQKTDVSFLTIRQSDPSIVQKRKSFLNLRGTVFKTTYSKWPLISSVSEQVPNSALTDRKLVPAGKCTCSSPPS